MRRMLQLIIAVCGLSACLGQDCGGSDWHPSPHHIPPIIKDQTYFQRNTKCQVKRHSQDIPVIWKLVFNDIGRYNATLSLTPCGITEYKVELKVNEGISKEECEKATKGHFTVKHSKRNIAVNVIDCEGDNCTGTPCNQVTLSFQFMFTACYLLKITPIIDTSARQPLYSKPQFVTADYRKQRIATTAQESCNINNQFYNSKKLTITTYMKDHPWKDLLLAATPITYELADKPFFYSKWTLQSNWPKLTIKASPDDQTAPTCSIDTSGSDNFLQFTFNNMTHFGNYTLKISIEDDRCAWDTLWSNSSLVCERWEEKIELSRETTVTNATIQLDEPETPEAITYKTLIITVCVSVLVLMAAIITFFAICKSVHARWQPKPVPQASVSIAPPSPPPQHPRVLLLYARDCQPFMDLMATFRRLLETHGGLEVADCFDSRQWGHISRDPAGWMRRHVTHANTRTVVVATKCASLQQQQRMVGDAVIRYAQPHAHDGLFVYALSLLEGGGGVRARAAYGDVVAVRFEGFTRDGDLLSGLGTKTRFVVPKHLDRLFGDLEPALLLGATQAMMESEEVHQLREDMKQLIVYRDENAKYLENLLLVQRILNT